MLAGSHWSRWWHCTLRFDGRWRDRLSSRNLLETVYCEAGQKFVEYYWSCIITRSSLINLRLFQCFLWEIESWSSAARTVGLGPRNDVRCPAEQTPSCPRHWENTLNVGRVEDMNLENLYSGCSQARSSQLHHDTARRHLLTMSCSRLERTWELPVHRFEPSSRLLLDLFNNNSNNSC